MQTIISEFESFMRKNGRYYNEFYVGIAANPTDRLVNGHNVSSDVPAIWSTAQMHTDTVRSIEQYFITKGTLGGTGGGNTDTQYVYAYLVTADTRE